MGLTFEHLAARDGTLLQVSFYMRWEANGFMSDNSTAGVGTPNLGLLIDKWLALP